MDITFFPFSGRSHRTSFWYNAAIRRVGDEKKSYSLKCQLLSGNDEGKTLIKEEVIIRYAPGFLKLLDLAAQSSHNRRARPRRGLFPCSLEDFRWSAITASDSKHLCVLNTSFLMARAVIV